MGTRLAISVTIGLILPISLPIAFSAPRLKEGDRALYYPTTVGEEWVMGLDGKEGRLVAPLRILSVSESRGVTTVEFAAVMKDGTLAGKSAVEVTDKGVCLVQNENGPLESPMWLLKLPVRPGNKWETPAFSPDGKLKKTIRKAESMEEVSTPVGKYNAIRVEVQEPDGTLWMTEWWAPGRGVVKETLSHGTFILKSITTGKK